MTNTTPAEIPANPTTPTTTLKPASEMTVSEKVAFIETSGVDQWIEHLRTESGKPNFRISGGLNPNRRKL